MPLLETLESWTASNYDKALKFCDADTLRDVRHVCQQVAFASRNGSSHDRREQFSESLKLTKTLNEKAVGSSGMVLTGMRSAAPLSLQSKMELPEAYRQYWEDGMVAPKGGKVDLPNPMFAGLVSSTEVLHYGTDPVLGFHLATAFAPLTEGSPLKPQGVQDGFRAAAAAKVQFLEWVSALRDLIRKGSVVRFVVADIFSFCHSLQHSASSDGDSANWFRRQFDVKPLRLDAGAYGKGKKGPVAFDMIDTSNLTDHFGALNTLVSTVPLLKEKPWATVYTEMLVKKEGSQQKVFDRLLCGNTATLSLLLGVSPVQFWTNSKAESHVDEVLLGLMAKSTQGSETQIHSRLSWKRDDQFSGQLDGRGSLHIEAKTLSRVLFEVYLDMFEGERLDAAFRRMNVRSVAYCNFHRGSFAVLLKFVKHRVVTDWQAMCRDLLDKIATDRALGMSSNYLQELCAHLYMLDVVEEPWVLNQASQRPEAGVLKRWSNIPPVVAVTLVVPRETLLRLYKGSREAEIASPTLVASLKSGPGASSQWHNMYGDVHIAFGNVKTSGSRDSEDLKLSIEPDRLGWEGSAPLVASFYAPAASLQVEPQKTLVGLYVTPTAQNMMVYTSVLGHEMTLFETGVLEASKVYVSKLIPGQTAYPASCGGVRSLKDMTESNNGGTKTKVVTDIPASKSRVSTLTGHLDIVSEKGRKLLKDKATIELRQTDPFAIDIVFGKNVLSYSLRFPIPVTKDGSRTRIARTSGYVEVIAPLANPVSSECLADYLFPTMLSSSRLPSALNAPHINLDNLPILDIEKKKEMSWLTTLVSMHFSKREKAKREGRNESGISDDPRVNFKESVFTMFMLASGLQGGQTGLFAINHPDRGGIHILFLVSALRLDGDTASVVLDAAVIPFTMDLIESGKIEDFLLVIETLQCSSISVNDAELALWKKTLPSLIERCRTWPHHPNCEYKKKGAAVPLNMEDGKQLLCSCGNGKLPSKFVALPEWDKAAPHAVRVAISPTFAVPFVEEVVDTSTFSLGGPSSTEDRCRKCGRTSTADGGALKRCQRCQGVKYCSVECQKKDWKTHRMECLE